MAKVTVTRTVNAPLQDVWASWDNFSDIYRFNPNLNGSHLLPGSASTGMGATRQCDMRDGKNFIQERIIGYDPHRKLVIDIYNGTLPLKSAVATFDFRAHGAQRSEVTMTMEFTPKMGLLGKMMLPLMKRQFRPMLQALLDANAAYVETGTEVSRAA